VCHNKDGKFLLQERGTVFFKIVKDDGYCKTTTEIYDAKKLTVNDIK
jgi:hypothetical protein